jgi:hypothetical protein
VATVVIDPPPCSCSIIRTGNPSFEDEDEHKDDEGTAFLRQSAIGNLSTHLLRAAVMTGRMGADGACRTGRVVKRQTHWT